MARPSPFHQGDAAVVPIHQQRRHKADGEIDRHGDGDDFDRLAGLVEHGAGEDLHQVRITNGDRQRRVLGQVQILAGKRRDDHAHRLRHHHKPQRRLRAQAERIGRFGLSVRDRANAGAHHLGDERRGVEREAEQQRSEFRQDLDAAGDIEASGDRETERQRQSGGQKHDERQADDQTERDQKHRRLLTGLFLALARPQMERDRGDDAEENGDIDVAETGAENRLRQEQAAVVENGAARNLHAVAQIGQRLKHGVIPEQQLQQQRDVAQRFDVGRGGFVDQPVLRQPRNADDETDDGREDDAEAGDQQRVAKTDPEGAAVSRQI